jgi:hypothetical protein
MEDVRLATTVRAALAVALLAGFYAVGFVLQATLAGSTTTVLRTVVGGPGPSQVQFPNPGCWRLVLSWSGHQDRMNLQLS